MKCSRTSAVFLTVKSSTWNFTGQTFSSSRDFHEDVGKPTAVSFQPALKAAGRGSLATRGKRADQRPAFAATAWRPARAADGNAIRRKQFPRSERRRPRFPAPISPCQQTLCTVPAQLSSYPQQRPLRQSCSCFRDSTDAGVRTAAATRQVVDAEREKRLVHSAGGPLSTTTSLNNKIKRKTRTTAPCVRSACPGLPAAVAAQLAPEGLAWRERCL